MNVSDDGMSWKRNRQMKKTLTAVAALAVLGWIGSGPALADGSGEGIDGSPHDFSLETWNPTGEICRVCHIPHDHGMEYWEEGLLWNRNLSSAEYTMYDASWSSTLDNEQSEQPDGISKLCLGCHDGTVALEEFGRGPGGSIPEGDTMISGRWAIGDGGEMRNTHPISIAYEGDEDQLNSKTNAMGTSGTIEDVLDFGKVQCSTCHDVHDQESVADTHLLRVAQSVEEGGAASGLCFTCHIK